MAANNTPSINACFLLLPAKLLEPLDIAAAANRLHQHALARFVLASSCVAAQFSFKGFYSIANAADLTTHVTVSLVGGEMQSSCQGREDALARAFERLHLNRLGRRVRQLVQASVTLATGSEPLRILPQ